jgi:cephalosporin hydroxylase
MGVNYLELAREAVGEHGAAQNPGELAELGEWLSHRKLAVIVEIGVYQGGTVWYWRKIAPAAKIVAVDRMIRCRGCDRRVAHRDCPRRRLREAGATLIEWDSRELATVHAVGRLAGDPYAGAGIDFLHIDGDHSFAGVESDFSNYCGLLAADGVLAIHDVTAATPAQLNDGKLPQDGVLRFWHNVKTLIPQAFEIREPGATWGGFGVLPKPEPRGLAVR